jgi:hypothetical protein
MPVAETLRGKLTEMVPLYDPLDTLPGDVIEQFHVLYRFENNRVGKPAYPEPETWRTLAEYLGVISIESKPTTVMPPQTPLKTPSQWDHVCPSCGVQSPNPNYCTSCGEAMEAEN